MCIVQSQELTGINRLTAMRKEQTSPKERQASWLCEHSNQPLKYFDRSGNNALTDGLSIWRKINVSKRSKGQDGNDREKRTRRFVDVGEDLWCISSFSEGGQSTGAGIDARKSDGKDRNADSDVDKIYGRMNYIPCQVHLTWNNIRLKPLMPARSSATTKGELPSAVLMQKTGAWKVYTYLHRCHAKYFHYRKEPWGRWW